MTNSFGKIPAYPPVLTVPSREPEATQSLPNSGGSAALSIGVHGLIKGTFAATGYNGRDDANSCLSIWDSSTQSLTEVAARTIMWSLDCSAEVQASPQTLTVFRRARQSQPEARIHVPGAQNTDHRGHTLWAPRNAPDLGRKDQLKPTYCPSTWVLGGFSTAR